MRQAFRPEEQSLPSGISASSLLKSGPRKSSRGFTLIEAAILILIIVVALVPIVRSMGGKLKGVGGQYATASDLSRQKNRELVAANALMESAMAGDTNLGFDVAAVPKGDTMTTARKSYGSSLRPIYYDWTVADVSYELDTAGNVVSDGSGPKRLLPTGNSLVQANLNIYEGSTGTEPTLVIPSFVFRQVTPYEKQDNKVGVVIIVDHSSTMTTGSTGDPGGGYSMGGFGNVASPWMYNRYQDLESTPGIIPTALKLDMWDDSQLDITWSKKIDAAATGSPSYMDWPVATDPVPETPYNEAFLGKGIHGLVVTEPAINEVGGGGSAGGAQLDCRIPQGYVDWDRYYTKNPLKANSIRTQFNQFFLDTVHVGNATKATKLSELCHVYPTEAAYTAAVNRRMSRMEAARNSVLELLVTLEKNQALSSNLRLGYVGFNSDISLTTSKYIWPMEGAKAQPVTLTLPDGTKQAANRLRFVNFRKQALLINRVRRTDNTGIFIKGGSPIATAIMRAMEMMYADDTLTDRIIVVVSDMQSTDWSGSIAINTHDFFNKLGNGTWQYNSGLNGYTFNNLNANGKKVTAYAVCTGACDPLGVNPAQNRNQWFHNLASGTGGTAYFADSNIDLQNAFKSVAANIQQAGLKADAERYNLQYN